MGQAIAVRQRTGRAWRRVVLWAVLVLLLAGSMTLVYGVAFDRGAASVDQGPVIKTHEAGSLSQVGDSCRQAAIVPRVGWVCTGH